MMKNIIICGRRGLLEFTVTSAIENRGFHITRIFTEEKDLYKRPIAFEENTVLIADDRYLEWLNALRKAGAMDATEMYVVPYYPTKKKGLPIFSGIGEFQKENLLEIQPGKPILPYLGTNVEDMCNLKCKACLYYANLRDKLNPLDPASFDRDLARLSELFSGITRFELIGGEPLLNPNLGQLIILARKYFPFAMLIIITNGLLITKMSDSLLETIRENGVFVRVSTYAANEKIRPEIKEFLTEHNINFLFLPENGLNNFYMKNLTLDPINDPVEASQQCRCWYCTHLCDGKIARCPIIMNIHTFNEFFDKHINEEGQDQDMFDIYKETSGSELMKKLDRPANMCRYCAKGSVMKWEALAGKPARIEDWLAE